MALDCLCGRRLGVVRAEGKYLTVKIVIDDLHCRIEGAWARCTGCGTVVAQLGAQPAAPDPPAFTPTRGGDRGGDS